ncbi:MAG TPA: DISARM system SNF2-like helicase DrmD [Pirellulales bacterium]|nr:DISARM system SNF2-like helicase DrmD [Pirellulales bacterium]
MTIPSPGQIARVRQRLYLVEETVAPPKARDSTLVKLSCVDDDAQGQRLEVLWEKEIDPEILSGEAWEAIAKRGFDEPRLFAAYLNTLRWNCVTATDPKLFQSPFRAGIRLDAYQLEPLRKALLMPRVTLMIGDDVGLGKTIEAALIACELQLRKKVKEIVVCCPPSMLVQWQEELETRFGLTFEILDKEYVNSVRRQRGYGVNPWSTHTRFLVSHRLLIDEAYAGQLRAWLGDFREGTLLILDEAHHAAPASGQRYAIDSQITRAVRDLAPRFEHRLFLSATPHNGHSNSFSALLEILDPQRFCRGVPVQRKLLDEVMVRRLKDDIRNIAGGFPERKVVQIDIDGLPADAPELRLPSLLDEYRQLREERLAGETKRKQAAAGLLITGLQQRLLSSIEAFARTLRVHRRTVQRHWQQSHGRQLQADASPQPISPGQLDLLTRPVGSDDERATFAEDELRAEEEAQVEAATAATLGPADGDAADSGRAKELFAREQALLDQMTEIAASARGRPDARVRNLIAWIREHMLSSPAGGAPELVLPADRPSRATHHSPLATHHSPKWNDTRVIIFTEYDDTKRYLREQLSAAIQGTDRAEQRIAIFHGPTPPDEREAIKQAFNTDPAKHPLRILIATDAAREGLNFQAHCWNLFHFDVPWNPSRMEQRNGRIDRKLQPNDKVYCHYFFHKQRPEDRILAALVRKTDRIGRELGSLAQVIDARLADMLGAGIRRGELAVLEGEIEAADIDAERRRTVEEELETGRQRQDQLRSQVEHLRTQLARSQDSIAFNQEHFRSAISSALELMGAEKLEQLGQLVVPSSKLLEKGAKPETPTRSASKELATDNQQLSSDTQQQATYLFPALDQRDGADPTWADTMDTLRAPSERGQKPWEWRRESPIRPVVFEDPGTMTDEVVHLHLAHRIVRRLLARFTAQGLVHHDLSRACLAQSSDAVPRVILLGRLCLYGPGAARLHEELVPVAARWIDPTVRKAPLAPYGRESETKTLDLLDESLLPRHGRRVARAVESQLQACAPRDVEELLPHLQARAEQHGQDAERLLRKRGDDEATAMRAILETQKRHIADVSAEHDGSDGRQLQLGFAEDELRQLEANRRHWTKRLAMIDHDLESEPERIRGVYQVKARRIEPIGLVYLWPVTG